MTTGPRPTDKFSFRTGALREACFGYTLCAHDELSSDDVPHTLVLGWDQGTWRRGPLSQLTWVAESACLVQVPKQQMVAVGATGKVIVAGRGEMYEENIYAAGTPDDREGWFREVREIAGKAYAVGMGRQAYLRDARDHWVRIDHTLPGSLEGMEGLESIHGFAPDELYAVGWGGEIWSFDGRSWSPAGSPTNLLLTRVLCAGDGNVYACGQAGLLVRGRGQTWEVVEQDDTQEDIWDLEWFGDTLYVSTTRFLYTLDGTSLRLVEFEEETPETCYHLSTADGVLWSIGFKDIVAFDGSSWTRIE